MADIGVDLGQLGIELPYSMPAEQSVLGAALLDASCVDEIARTLKPEMFYARQNRAVCVEMFALAAAGVPADIVMLADRLAGDAAFPSAADARGYLVDLADTVPSISNLSHYIGIVYEKYVKRQLMEHAGEILQQAGDDLDTDVMLENAERRLYEIRAGKQTGEVQLFKYALVDIMTRLYNLAGPNRDEYLGIPTHFTYLDKVLSGLGKSDLIILASRPGMGKTSFALNIMVNVARQKIPVIFFSLEMTNDQLAARVISSEARINSSVFRTGVQNDADWPDLIQMGDLLAPLPIFLDDSSMITINDMKSKVRQLNSRAQASGQKPVGLVVIDYLQLMSTGKRSENRVQEISEITRNLKIMAKELNVPLLVLSQLSRSTEKGRGDRRPILSDLRDSGSIEQDADVVMFLYREAYYDTGPDADPMAAQCIVAKNRHGETDTVELIWDGAHTRYVERDMGRG